MKTLPLTIQDFNFDIVAYCGIWFFWIRWCLLVFTTYLSMSDLPTGFESAGPSGSQKTEEWEGTVTTCDSQVDPCQCPGPGWSGWANCQAQSLHFDGQLLLALLCAYFPRSSRPQGLQGSDWIGLESHLSSKFDNFHLCHKRMCIRAHEVGGGTWTLHVVKLRFAHIVKALSAWSLCCAALRYWTLKLFLGTSSHPDHGFHVKKHRLSRDPVCCWDPFPRRNLEAHVMHGTRFIFIPGPRDPGPQTLLGGPGHSSDPLSHEQMIQGWTLNIIKQQLMWLFDIFWIIHNNDILWSLCVLVYNWCSMAIYHL